MRAKVESFLVVLLAGAVLPSCGSHTRAPYAVVSAPRDWNAHPGIVEIDPTEAAALEVRLCEQGAKERARRGTGVWANY